MKINVVGKKVRSKRCCASESALSGNIPRRSHGDLSMGKGAARCLWSEIYVGGRQARFVQRAARSAGEMATGR